MECERVFAKNDLGGSLQLILSFLSKTAVSRLNDTFELVI